MSDAYDARYDTGRGYGIVVSSGQDPASSPYMRTMAQGLDGRRSLISSAFSGLSRFTFNAVLLGIILTILAIPTAIGLLRLANSSTSSVVGRGHISPTARPVPTAYPGYQTYRGRAYTIAYPSDWGHSTTSATITTPGGTGPLSIPEVRFGGASNVAVIVGAIPVMPADQLQPILDGVTATYQSGSGISNFQLVATAHTGPLLDGQPSLLEQFSFSQFVRGQTVAMEGEALSANPAHGAYTYIIVFLAPRAQFASLRDQYLKAMLASFRIVA